MKVLAISGSLRRGSHNSKLLYAAAELLPEEVEFELWQGLKAVPPYDEDDVRGQLQDAVDLLLVETWPRVAAAA